MNGIVQIWSWLDNDTVKLIKLIYRNSYGIEWNTVGKCEYKHDKRFYKWNTCHSHMFAIIYIYVTVANYLYHKLLVLLAPLSGYSQVTPWVGSLTAHVISISQLIWRASAETLLLQKPSGPGCLMSSGWLDSSSPRSEKQMGALPIQAWEVLWLGIAIT